MRPSLIFLFVISTPVWLIGQKKFFWGEWTKIGTTYIFEFELHIEHKSAQQVEGIFFWKISRLNEDNSFSVAHYKNRIGLTAMEYVRGTYDPATREYYLVGYKKDDPNLIIALDHYKLQVDETGQLGGSTKAHNTWLGRINGTAIPDPKA